MSARAPSHVTGVILAGGRSSRFDGAPKGLARVGGERIVDRVARAMGPACDELLIVANDIDAATWLADVPVVRDVSPGLGALGGLHTALTMGRGHVLVVAWDMPFVPASLLTELRARATDDVDAVVPIGGDGPEPLCALYACRCGLVAERLLASGERRARAVAELVHTTWLGPDDVARHGDPGVLFFSVNTPDDLERANALSRDNGCDL